MKLMESTKNGMIEIRSIETITGLENYQIVMMERGDKMKVLMKKANCVGGNKNHYSVKAIKECVAEAEMKQNKKNNAQGGLCCVCTDWFAMSQLDDRGICPHCQL